MAHHCGADLPVVLQDEELIGVLANTKAKAAEVNQKLISADETRTSINEKREQFRKVSNGHSGTCLSVGVPTLTE